MVIGQPGGDDPETFECLGKGTTPRVFVCGGGQRPVAERNRGNHCNACERGLSTFGGWLRTAIHTRQGWERDCAVQVNCTNVDHRPPVRAVDWNYWGAHFTEEERREHMAEEKALFRAGTSTACDVVPDGWVVQWPEEENEGEQQVDPLPVAPVAEQENPAINVSEEDAEWLTETNPAPPENEAPAGQAATSGIIYLGENRSAWTGWVMSGKTSGSNRLGGYQTGAPFRDYDFIATARVEEGLSDAEDRLQDALDAQATQRGVASDTGDSEWFEIDRDLAVEILQELDGITGFSDLRIENDA
jgi:hypothetical protein